ncbi:hypothetical protein GCM10027019_17980 [Melaminivora jejuensis]|uniref:hypothetical protein n=1 Tax=Melaminivora jejuensis TaxID=1267217 RepID=UPI001ADF8580|nr:hypothetical protein [Melaminivora jejuensis]UHJ65632.1 hypothetical protein LVC68_03675 [Melaminivora jejuensis]
MQPRELQVIADGFTYLESPRWHDGALWFVDFYTHRAVRMAEGGRILEQIDTAPEGIFAVALGGDDGRTLFLCAAQRCPPGTPAGDAGGRAAFCA